MGKRILTFLLIYVYFVVLFLIEKLFFMFFHFDMYKEAPFFDWLLILKNGLLLDLSVAGYFSVLPGLFLLFSVWLKNQYTITILSIYFIILSLFISIIFIVDPILFGYWGTHLDSTVFFYMKNMKDVFASVKIWEIILGFLGMIVCFVIILTGFKRLINDRIIGFTSPKRKISTAFLLFLLTAFLFIPIRGGFTVSTMNVGKAYFSTNAHYNQAAINPYFNFFYSLSKSEKFSEQFHYMPDGEMEAIIMPAFDKQIQCDSIPQLFNTNRPNIILFVLESFGSVVIEPLGGIKDVAPNMTKFFNEGVAFSNFYANSFRTDRGLVSVLSGYPAQAMTSIMKYPKKTGSLPAIPKTLNNAGYSCELFYGGDIDFTNMRSYFFGCCHFEKIISDVDFPLKSRMSKWGAPDHIVIDTLSSQLQNRNLQQPFFKMVLTLSSHEPFEVPFAKFEDPYLNSVAYTDSCLGAFVDKLKKTPYWENTVLIFTPDHAAAYPQKVEAFNPDRFHVPLIFTGGAITQPVVFDQPCSQMDLAAILFSQLQLPYNDFEFSKNILNPNVPQFGYYAYNNGFGIVDSTGIIVFDNNAQDIILKTTESIHTDVLLNKGKALTQYSYSDFEKR